MEQHAPVMLQSPGLKVANKAVDFSFVQRMYTHDRQSLLKLAGLESKLNADAPTASPLDKIFAIVYRWPEHSTYRLIPNHEAVEPLAAIDDPVHGVF